MPALRWLSLALFVVALALGGTLLVQRQATIALQAELALLRDESRQLQQARKENARLTAAQPPAAELERLRADHAALVRLRGEIEQMKARVGSDSAP